LFQVQSQARRGHQRHVGPPLDEVDQLRRVEPGLRPEPEHHAVAFPIHGLDPQAIGHHADASVVGKVQDRRRQRAVPVADFLDGALQFLLVPCRRDAPVDHEPLVHVGM
jgi:hypothetical protein